MAKNQWKKEKKTQQLQPFKNSCIKKWKLDLLYRKTFKC